MIYFIVNETSRTGKGASAWNELNTLVQQSGIEYKVFKTEYEGHATKLAKDICNKNDEDICLITVGGDGTMNEVINGMDHFDKVRFGMIPNGSGNDFGHGLGLPNSIRENWEMIYSCIKEGRDSYQAIDLGQVSWDKGSKRRLFGISSGIGMDAIVSKKAMHSKLKTFLNKLHIGKLTYVLITIYTLFSMKTTRTLVEYFNENHEIIEEKVLSKMIFTAAMNLYAEGGGVPMAPSANAIDEKLSFSSAFGIPKWRTFFCLPLLMASKHEKLKGFYVKNATSVHLSLSEPMVLHADGEYLGDPIDVIFTALPQKLKMLKK